MGGRYLAQWRLPHTNLNRANEFRYVPYSLLCLIPTPVYSSTSDVGYSSFSCEQLAHSNDATVLFKLDLCARLAYKCRPPLSQIATAK